jgi:uncharacterized membrane protein YciS (DUF1049 family)
MRLFCLIFLVVFAGAVGLFAYQNQQHVTLAFLNYNAEVSVALLAGVVFGLGMLSGWTIVGMLRRSFHRLTEEPAPREYARS